MRISLFAILSLIASFSLEAGCIKCDQTTGYVCYHRLDGTKSGCDTPSDAGCVTWGSCTPSGPSDDDEVFSLGRSFRMNNDLELAAVRVGVRAFPVQPAPRRKPSVRSVL